VNKTSACAANQLALKRGRQGLLPAALTLSRPAESAVLMRHFKARGITEQATINTEKIYHAP
jgi:hypothetical protein